MNVFMGFLSIIMLYKFYKCIYSEKKTLIGWYKSRKTKILFATHGVFSGITNFLIIIIFSNLNNSRYLLEKCVNFK